MSAIGYVMRDRVGVYVRTPGWSGHLTRFLKNRMRTTPQLTGTEHEKAWLLHVAANLSKNRIAYNKVRAADELSETLAAEEREDLSFVWDAVKQLPQVYRETVHLYYEESYATAEIARVLGRKESTVRSDLRRARAQLKDMLKEVYDFE